MRKLLIIIMCVIAVSFLAVGCGEKEEEKINSNQLVQPPADPEEEEENLKKSWKELKKEMTKKEEENTLEKRIKDIKNSKLFTPGEKKELIQSEIEEDIMDKKNKRKLEKILRKRGLE